MLRLLAPLVSVIVLSLPASTLAATRSERAAVLHARSSVGLSLGALLVLGSGYDTPQGSAAVRVVQLRLAHAGDSPGPIDGRYGPLTRAAVVRFQATHGLAVDGIVGPQTWALTQAVALSPGLGVGRSGLVAALQRRLAAAGFGPGPIDGRYGVLTEHAVRRFQAAHKLPADGIVGPLTRSLLLAPGRTLLPVSRHPVVRRSRPTARPVQQTPTAHRTPSDNVRTAPRPANAPSPVLLVVLGLVALGVVLTLLWRKVAAVTYRRPGASSQAGVRLARDLPRTAGRSVPPAPAQEAVSRKPAAPPATVLAAWPKADSGNPRGTEAAYRRADEGGDAEAAFRLAVLLELRGAADEAEAAYRRADQRGHGPGALNLGVMLEERGAHAEAEEAYRRADQRGEAGGAFNVGVLLEERGSRDEAEAAYRRADQRGNGPGASNLGVMLEERGAHAEAEEAYRRADQRGEAAGAFNLGGAARGARSTGRRRRGLPASRMAR